jgi:arsenite methyltransferase
VLGNDARLRLLHALHRGGEVPVGELADLVGMRPQAASSQLQRLADRGIVAARRDGNRIFYSIADACIPAVLHLALREQIRDHYTTAARAVTKPNSTTSTDQGGCCADDACCSTPISLGVSPFGADQYNDIERDGLPADAVAVSLGCGNPLAIADLHEDETELDLGCGGIAVLLSARRIGPTGTACGLDITDEMLDLARRNAAQAGVTNVQFFKGDIEAIPLPDASIDVMISNCVINLSTDKPAVFSEIHSVLRPGGRLGISDVVADDHLTPTDRAARGNHAGCLTFREYRDHLVNAAFTHIEVTPTHSVTDAVQAAIVRAAKTASDLVAQSGLELPPDHWQAGIDHAVDEWV